MLDAQRETAVVSPDESSCRLDQFLSKVSELSRTRSVELIEGGLVSVNERMVTAKKHALSPGDRVSYSLPEDQEIEAIPQDIPLDVVFEDEHLIVVNKKQGMVVHPAPGNPDGTLVNALLFHCRSSLSGINGKLRPGIVHRLDKDTSGLLIAAKHDRAHVALADMIKQHDFLRQYQAILYGSPKEEEGTVSLAVGRSRKDRKKMATYPLGSPGSKDAVTHYRVLEHFRGYSFVELTLETGRTHQIRVHMLSQGCPVLADPLYAPGRKTFGLVGQCLHAGTLGFHHPITGEDLLFHAPLPPYFSKTLEVLKAEYE